MEKITKKSVSASIYLITIITILLVLYLLLHKQTFSNELFHNIRNFIGIFLTIYTFFIGIIIFLENKNPSKTTAWLLVLFLLPVLGFVLYIIFGQDLRKKYKLKKKRTSDYKHLEDTAEIQKELLKEVDLFRDEDSHVKTRLINLLLRNSDSPFTINNTTEVLTNGEKTFDSILAELKKAKNHIHMEYYIIRSDVIGNKIKDILVQKALEGVEVRVIYDSVGCWRLSKKYIKDLREVGVEIHSFFPVVFPVLSRELNYRNHRKIIVIDGKIGYLGGLNIGDEYLGYNPQLGFWRDTHLKIEGEAVYSLQNIFLRDWEFVSNNPVVGSEYYPKLSHYGNQLVQVISSGPDGDWKAVFQGYFTMIANAEKYIWITTPYLVPGSSISTALTSAALSGVDVKIIIPSKPDHKIVHWASLGNIEDLLRAGVKVYKYNKGFIHSKILMVDGVAASVGSANLDIRSFEINFEVNSFIYDNDVVRRLELDFEEDLKESEEFILEDFSKRGLPSRFRESLGRLFSPIL